MATVTIGLRYGRTLAGDRVTSPRDEVDLDRLSPRARALALTVAACLGGKAGVVWIESDRPRREGMTDAERAVYGDPARDEQPVRQEWSAWDRFHADAPEDAYWYLERQAHKIPEGWHVIGPTPHERVAPPEQPTEDWFVADAAEHMGIAAASTRKALARLGVRPYRHEPAPHGGFRSLYAAAAVRAAHAQRRGQGYRTDLQKSAG